MCDSAKKMSDPDWHHGLRGTGDININSQMNERKRYILVRHTTRIDYFIQRIIPTEEIRALCSAWRSRTGDANREKLRVLRWMSKPSGISKVYTTR